MFDVQKKIYIVAEMLCSPKKCEFFSYSVPFFCVCKNQIWSLITRSCRNIFLKYIFFLFLSFPAVISRKNLLFWLQFLFFFRNVHSSLAPLQSIIGWNRTFFGTDLKQVCMCFLYPSLWFILFCFTNWVEICTSRIIIIILSYSHLISWWIVTQPPNKIIHRT